MFHRPTSAALLAALAGCGPGIDVELVPSGKVATVVTLHWSTRVEEPSAAWVEYGRGGAVEGTIPVEPAGPGPYHTVVVGMKPGYEYGLRVVVEDEAGVQRSSQEQLFTTGYPLAEFPDLRLALAAEGSFEGYLLSSFAAQPTTPIIVDPDGDLIWWYKAKKVANIARAHLSRSGDILLMDMNIGGVESNNLRRIRVDGTAVEAMGLPWAVHDFLELPDGTITFLALSPGEIGGEPMDGNQVVERHPDGSFTVVFDIWTSDHNFPFDPSGALVDGRWPHANAIDYLEEEDAYLVSFYCFDAIARIDRVSGAVDWILGSEYGDFTLPDGSTELFDRTHQMHWLGDDRLLVFVNGSTRAEPSRAVELVLDHDAGVAEPVWEYWSDPALESLTLGDVSRLPSGNTLVTYSYSGAIHEVDPSGEPVWILEAGVGGVLGYTTWLEELPRPGGS